MQWEDTEKMERDLSQVCKDRATGSEHRSQRGKFWLHIRDVFS